MMASRTAPNDATILRPRRCSFCHQVYDNNEKQFVKKTWADVRVGDVITVYKVRSHVDIHPAIVWASMGWRSCPVRSSVDVPRA